MERNLLPLEVVEEIEKIYQFGAKKYSPHDWKSREWEDMLGAAFGHIASHMRGRLYDNETGEPHLAHALCRLTMAYWLIFEKNKEV